MKHFLLIILLSSCFCLDAQQSKVDILQPIKTMFNGMRAGDSLVVRNCFIEHAGMHSTYVNKEGKKTLRKGSLNDFINAIGTPHDEVWDEQIFTYRIEHEGTLATVWTDYTFYLGEKLSHCGVNTFQMVDTENGWKILNITDTRRKEKCREKISSN